MPPFDIPAHWGSDLDIEVDTDPPSVAMCFMTPYGKVRLTMTLEKAKEMVRGLNQAIRAARPDAN